MDSSAEFWREPNTNSTVSGSPSIQVLKDSISSDKNGSGRRSSDGGPPPFNRTRSFKTKQLVRSQAIRESQSPPRVPSPRPPSFTDTKENKLATIKVKSASVDLDDRLSYEHIQPSVRELSSNETILQKKSDFSNDAISLTYSDSFKNNNISTKNILVSTSGDKKNLGANVVSICSSTSESININKSSNETVNDKNDSANCNTTANSSKDETFQQTKIGENKMTSQNSSVESESTSFDSQCLQTEKDSSSLEIDSNEILEYTNNNNDNQCLSLDIRLETIKDTDSCTKTQNINNSQHSSQEYQQESIDIILEPLQSSASDVNYRKQKVTLKNLKNSNFIKNNDSSPLIIHDAVCLKNKETCYHQRNMPKVEVHQVEIQVTSGEQDKNSYKQCDCGIGPSLDEDEAEMEDVLNSSNRGEGRRAICPSKQDSGVCCWDSFCGDNSPEIMTSDNEEEISKMKKKISLDIDHQSCIVNEMCRCSEKAEKQLNRRNGGMLTVQRASSGGNSRLLRKQSSGGSIDSGQHSLTSPFLSRDNSSEIFNLNPCDIGELSKFIKDTLNKNQKDRITLLKIEHELVTFVRDPTRREHKFPATSSYGRLLVHRCADLFGLRHGVDPATRHVVIVAKLPQGGLTYRIPLICPFQQWCSAKFPSSPTGFCEMIPQAKSILKRDTHSLDEEAVVPTVVPPKLIQTPRSKSFEQREEEYVKARRRIFSSPGQEDTEIAWDWEENRENEEEPEICTPRILLPDSNKTARLLKVQSMEHEKAPTTIRGVVSKAHSFGGYGGKQGVQRGDSITSTSSAPPHRILSRQGELASTCWRLSPSSSGYKTLSGRSDSVTPSPTSTPNTAATDSASSKNTETKTANNSNSNVVGNVLWAITDMSTVPPGAVIIHPQTGQALTNSDGTIYHYDPEKPPHSALLQPSQISENVKVLSNPERRRCRLEKQRATLSPGTEYHTNSGSDKSPDNSQLSPVANQDNNSISTKIESKKSEPQTTIVNDNSEKCPSEVNSPNCDNNLIPENSSPPIQSCEPESYKKALPNYTSQSIPSNKPISKISPEPNTDDNIDIDIDKNDINSSEAAAYQTCEDDDHSNNLIHSQNKPMEDIRCDISNLNINQDLKPNEKTYHNTDRNFVQLENFEHEGNHNKNSCAEYDSGIDGRQIDNFAPAYSEVPDPRYYGTIIQGSPQQYYTTGHVYDGNAQEVYPTSPQTLNFNVRANESSLNPTVPQHPMSHPHLIFASPTETTFPTSGEICYPAPPAQVLIPPPPYRLHEPEAQPPQYHVISTDQHQQPVMVTLSNKLPEHEIAPQSLAGFPLSYPQVDRTQVISPQIVGLTAPHPTLGYQLQGSSGWGCWPQVTVYAPHPQQPPADDGIPKYQPHSGAFIPQHSENPLNQQSVPTIPPSYFPHPNFIPPQPNQYYQSYPHPTPMMQHQFPMYQQYNPGRNSVLSQEGCSTPGFQTYDSHANVFTFPKPENMYAESLNKTHTNVKSPKPNSRTASNSGSSRTTPLTSNLPMQNMGICDVNFSNVDQNINMNALHFIHPTVNYIPLAYPYVNPIELAQSNNSEGSQMANANKPISNENQNFIKYNKQLKESEKYIPLKNPKQNPPLIHQKSECSDVYSQDKGEKSLKHGILSDPSENSHLKMNINNMSFDLKNINRNKDKRKNFKPSHSLSIDLETNYDQTKSPVKEKTPLIQNYQIQHSNPMKPNYSNDKTSVNLNRNIPSNRADNDHSKKTQFVDVHKQTVIASSLSNEAKTFVPKNNVNGHSWNTRENSTQVQNDIDHHHHHVTNRHYSNQTFTNSNVENISESKNSWRKNQNYSQKDYHNFPKNFNRQINRSISSNGQSEKSINRNLMKDKQIHNNENPRIKPQLSFDTPQAQITPTMVNAPPVPWNPHGPPLISNIPLCNAQNNSSGSPTIFNMPNLSQPPPMQPLRQISQSNDSPCSSSPNTPSIIPKPNMAKMQVQGNAEMCVTQRFIDTNIVGLPLSQSATFYQRTQTIQNLTGGLGLVQTPPLHGHSAFFLRQVPSSWFRRPAAPALFGPGPSLTGQIRARPPRPHQVHPRNFYH